MDPTALTEEDRICADLRKIGLGSRYQRMKFGDLPQSKARDALYNWTMHDDFYSEVVHGGGASLHGGPDAHELFMLLARATHLRGVKSRIINLTVLVNEVSTDTISTALLDARAIFVTPFFRSEYTKPLNDFQKLAVEDFLLERLDDSRAVFTMASSPLQEARAWWSAILIRRLQVSNLEVGLEV